jgi:methionine-rich copper-binding protein CopC
MIKRMLLPLTLLVAIAAATTPEVVDAEFHFALNKSMPEAESAIESPPEIRLWFTEVPEAETTSIRLIAADEEAIETGDVTQDTEDEQSFAVVLERALSPGTYTVSWRAMGSDGHVVRSAYEFTVVAQ